MGLIIPQKTLSDKYKLKDFQDDFIKLYQAYSLPVKVEFIHDENSIYVTDDSGKVTHYKFQKEGYTIVKIDNLTDGTSMTMEWRK